MVCRTLLAFATYFEEILSGPSQESLAFKDCGSASIFFFALIAISNKFDFCVFFFFHFFFFRNRELKKMFIPFDFLHEMKEKCRSIV